MFDVQPRAAAVASKAALLFGNLLLFCATSLFAAEPVRITFLPPPMEGTLSLGIYDRAGKLVRTLHREAGDKAFTAGLNGFITAWDGKDDAGKPAPAGTYRARGYSVGELEVEGVAYHCNDWFTSDDSPRIRSLNRVASDGEGLRLTGRLADGQAASLRATPAGGISKTELPGTEADLKAPRAILDLDPGQSASGELLADAQAVAGGEVKLQGTRGDGEWLAVGNGKALLCRQGMWTNIPLGENSRAIGGCFGKAETTWLIERRGEAAFVTQRSRSGDVLRELPITAGEPHPMFVDADVRDAREKIALLEDSHGVQRLRVLTLRDAAAAEGERVPVSTWEVTLSKTIRASDDFASVADKLGRPQPFKPEEKISVRLQPNELLKNVARNVDLQIAHDEKGAYLRAADGLPLCRVTETPHLKWAVMGREEGGKAVTIFQSDGAVVEEFRAKKLANMMAFDAGEYEWAPGGGK